MNKIVCRTCLTQDRQTISLQKIQPLLQQIKLVEIGTVGNICWECYNTMRKFSKFKLQTQVALNSLNYEINTTQKSLSVLAVQSKCLYDYKFYHDVDPLTVMTDIKTEYLIKEEDTVINSDQFCENVTEEKSISIEITELRDKLYCTNIQHSKLTGNSDWEHDESISEEIDYPISIIKDTGIADVGNSEYSHSMHFLDTKDDSNETDCNGKLSVNDSNRGCLLPEEVTADNDVVKDIENTLNTQQKLVRNHKNFKFKGIKQNDIEKDVISKFAKIILTVEEMLKHREEKSNQPNFKKLPYKCDTCVLGFTRVDKFHSHMSKAHSKNNANFICDVCDTRYPKKKRLERHCRKHFECYRCLLCKFETVELWSIHNHCQQKHSYDHIDKIHCPQCVSVFRNPEELAEHTRTEHILHCDECGEKFKSRNTLRSHVLRMHQMKRDFVCEICRKTFKTKSRLESHAATHSSALAQKLAYCSVCRVQYKNLHVYRNHIRNSAAHSNDTFTCPVCNKKFVSKVYWTSHYNFYHLNKFQYLCEICNKPFISDWRLKNHRQKHHGYSRTRDHTCSVCGKKFYTSSTLRAHRLIHSEERSYMCEDCGDTFKQRAALYTHSRLVHKGVKRKKYVKSHL